jgi:6-phosphogluconolactonase (cycloisomerase 2 family)
MIFDSTKGALSLEKTALWPSKTASHVGPTHCAVAPSAGAPSARYVVAANYATGQTAVFPATVDGAVSPAHQVLDYATGSHAHCVAFAPDGR